MRYNYERLAILETNDGPQWSIPAMATLPPSQPTQTLIMKLDADMAWRDLQDSLDGVFQNQAWAVPHLRGTADLATRGSILEIVQHLATCKFMYASTAFRYNQYGWDDCFARVRELGVDWEANLGYLREAQSYWMESWGGIQDIDLTEPRMTNWGAQWPTWRIISTISHHDSYHAGQIALLRAILAPSDKPCATTADYSLASLELQF